MVCRNHAVESPGGDLRGIIGWRTPAGTRRGAGAVEHLLTRSRTKRKTAEVELAPDALALALDAWRKHLVDAQEKEDILGVKNFLTRFVSKIDVGYKTAHMHYTYPLDDLKHLNSSGSLWGHLSLSVLN